MRLAPILLIALLTAACGDDKASAGGDGGGKKDAPDTPTDAAIDAPPAPAMIMLMGTATERLANGTAKVNGATIEAFENSNETTPIATTTTNAQGNFTLVVDTGGVALNGFIKAKKAGLKDSYLYPTGFIDSDLAMIPIQMISSINYDALSVLAQGNQLPGKGLIALQVLEGTALTSKPVAGAAVASNPAGSVVRYNVAGSPSATATVTATDGVAYIFNVPVGVNVVVSATKSGSTFSPHNMKAVADQLTTTLVTP